MTSRSVNFVSTLFIALSCAGLLAACAASVPDYTGTLAQEPASLTPYENRDAGIRLSLPPGWVSKPQAAGASEVKAEFKKEGTSAVLQVYCQGAFVSRTGLSIMPLRMVDASTTSNARLWPDYTMPNGAGFSAWTGTVAASGQQVPMNFYITWKMPSGFGCKYAVFTVVGKAEAGKIEGDFLAITRSLN
jgi:hypothetical protein